MKRGKRNLIIITSDNLRLREGPTYSRVLCYHKAVLDVFDFFLLDNTAYRGNEICEFDKEICYEKHKRKSMFYRSFLKTFDFINPIRGALKINSKFDNKDTSVLLYSSNFVQSFISVIVLRFIFGYKVIIEKNEMEIGRFFNRSLPRGLKVLLFLFFWPIDLILSFLQDQIPFLCNHIIVISTSFERRYSKCSRKISLIPILADTRLYSNTVKQQGLNKIKFLYMGSFNMKKDNIFGIINVIKDLAPIDKQKLSFNFVGSGSKRVIERLIKEINNNHLGELISVKSSIPFKQVAEEIKNYDATILIRENNIQNRYGFSTKIAESLGAGLLVICNPVSDVRKYLTHKRDCLIVDNENLSEVLTYVLNNNIDQIRIKGKEVAEKEFDCYLFKDKLLNIL